jgi:histone deacetylase 6
MNLAKLGKDLIAMALGLEPSAKVQAKQVEKAQTNTMCGALYDVRMTLHKYEAPEAPSAADHPECPARISRIWDAIKWAGFMKHKRWAQLQSREAKVEELRLIHDDAIIQNVLSQSSLDDGERGDLAQDGDAFANKYSPQAAQLAAGCAIELATNIVDPTSIILNGFACVRPPGHHACTHACSGFCIFNNVAVASKIIQERHGVERILIIDWDVHHGDGTVEITRDDPSVLFISLHNFTKGFYPGTGPPTDTGGCRQTVNIGWTSERMGDDEYLYAFQEVVMPIAREFDPQIVLVSAGFDAAKGDPLGGMLLSPQGYSAMTRSLLQLAGGKVGVVLEGGYNLDAISASAVAVVKELLDHAPAATAKRGLRAAVRHVVPSEVRESAVRDVKLTIRAHAQTGRWECMRQKQAEDDRGRAEPQGKPKQTRAAPLVPADATIAREQALEW